MPYPANFDSNFPWPCPIVAWATRGARLLIHGVQNADIRDGRAGNAGKAPRQRAGAATFAEIYARFDEAEAATQAGRCSQCGVPFCQVHCPVQNNIPDWLKLAAEGRLEEAYEVSSATNNFPEICGRICPQDRLCEGNCVIEQAGHGTVTIGAIERYITDTAWEKGWVKPVKPRAELHHSIGIIGAGPAGLAAAEQLRAQGLSRSWSMTATTASAG